MSHPCQYVKAIPNKGRRLLDLPPECQVDNLAGIDDQKNFATFAIAWNEQGLGIQVEVRGKDKPLQGDISRPRGSDGFTLWLDTRDSRTSHRGSRHCHQFHVLATGGGPDRDEPAFVQSKIHRALEDAPIATEAPVRLSSKPGGYVLEVFLPAGILNGYDPEQHPRLGIFYSIRDDELGEQTLGIGPDFPFWEDPSLWSVLELIAPA